MNTWTAVCDRAIRMNRGEVLYLTGEEMQNVAKNIRRVHVPSKYIQNWIEEFLRGEVTLYGVRIMECPGVLASVEDGELA